MNKVDDLQVAAAIEEHRRKNEEAVAQQLCRRKNG
jgi:hypothetical protein